MLFIQNTEAKNYSKILVDEDTSCNKCCTDALTCQWTRSQPCAPENSKLLLISKYRNEQAYEDIKYNSQSRITNNMEKKTM